MTWEPEEVEMQKMGGSNGWNKNNDLWEFRLFDYESELDEEWTSYVVASNFDFAVLHIRSYFGNRRGLDIRCAKKISPVVILPDPPDE